MKSVLPLFLTFCSFAFAAESTIKTVYIVPSSHWDLGFVQPPETVRDMVAHHLDEVLRLARTDPDFRWTIESVWQIEEWLKRRRGLGDIIPGKQKDIDDMMSFLKSGKIELSASWGSMHTDFMSAEELNRLIYPMAALSREFGIHSDMAMMNDVPGHAFQVASVLAGSDVKYLSVGANLFLPGGTSLAPGRVPFYWEGPDGSRVLTWVSQSARGGYPEALADYFLDPFTVDPYGKTEFYSFFHAKEPRLKPLEIMERGVALLLNRYSQAGYSYDAVMVLHSHDFLPPTSVQNLEKAVRLWNGSHRTPLLKIAMPSEFFRYIEGKYKERIPVRRGEWSGQWSDAKSSSPAMSAMARRNHEGWATAQTLWSAASILKSVVMPQGNFDHLLHLMFTYDEHSGAGNAGWPGINSREGIERQNEEYVEELKSAHREEHDLYAQWARVMAEPAQSPPDSERPLTVFNPSSWERTDVMQFLVKSGSHITRIIDKRSGRAVAFDSDSDGQVYFVAENIPATGYASFAIEQEPGPGASTIQRVDGNTIENEFFHLAAAGDGALQAITDRRSGRELAPRADVHFNELLREFKGKVSSPAAGRASEIIPEKGRIVSRLTIRQPNSCLPEVRYVLYRGLDRLEIHNELDTSKLPFDDMAHGQSQYFFAFPFQLDSKTLGVRPEAHYGFLQLPRDYLPGARNDSVSSQHVIALTNPGRAVLLAHRQAFRFVFPGKTLLPDGRSHAPAVLAGDWPLSEAALYSKVLAHTDQGEMRFTGVTNFPTVEPGLSSRKTFEYAIRATGAFNDVAALRFGEDFSQPLRVFYDSFGDASSQSFFSTDQPGVRVVVVKAAERSPAEVVVTSPPPPFSPTKRFVIRLQEITGRPARNVHLQIPAPVKEAEIVNLTEMRVLRKGVPIRPLTIDLEPYQTVTVRVQLQ